MMPIVSSESINTNCKLWQRKIGDGRYTALELIHENYPYNGENVEDANDE